jgi:hypothetical protein
VRKIFSIVGVIGALATAMPRASGATRYSPGRRREWLFHAAVSGAVAASAWHDGRHQHSRYRAPPNDSQENSLVADDDSTVTLLAEIAERNKSAFDVNAKPSPVTAPE